MKKQTELFTTVGHLIRKHGKNIIGEVVDEVYFFEGNNRNTLQRIQSKTDKNSYFYVFQMYDMQRYDIKMELIPVIPNIFPEYLLCELLKKAREKGWNL